MFLTVPKVMYSTFQIYSLPKVINCDGVELDPRVGKLQLHEQRCLVHLRLLQHTPRRRHLSHIRMQAQDLEETNETVSKVFGNIKVTIHIFRKVL